MVVGKGKRARGVGWVEEWRSGGSVVETDDVAGAGRVKEQGWRRKEGWKGRSSSVCMVCMVSGEEYSSPGNAAVGRQVSAVTSEQEE